MLLEQLQRDDLQGLFVGRRDDDGTGDPLIGSVLPSLCTHAPPIPWGKARETVLGNGCDKVVPLGSRKLQELLGHDATNRVKAPVAPVGIAAPVPEPARQGVHRAWLQITSEDVERRQHRHRLPNSVD